MTTSLQTTRPVHRLSLVVPVYQGAKTLPALVAEIEPFTKVSTTPGGLQFQVVELLTVHDAPPDNSPQVMQHLAEQHSFIRNIWLSRNYGQHPATLAGMASASGDWVITLDEDGQHNPADIPAMLDVAVTDDAQLVYAQSRNPPPHGPLRNFASYCAQIAFRFLLGKNALGRYSSFRLVDGEIARSLAAYCANGVYLDVALTWLVSRVGHCLVTLRNEDRQSGYNFLKLVSHFWRLLVSSGTRPLRFIAMIGVLSLMGSAILAVRVIYEKLAGDIPVQGWTSLIITTSFFSGITLFSLGVVAEYLGVTLTVALGKPLYVTVSRPRRARPELGKS